MTKKVLAWSILATFFGIITYDSWPFVPAVTMGVAIVATLYWAFAEVCS